ncbi:enoyl-CoA hydratase [Nocardia cyriacigeorgica]|uniref:Enoyl-CoA hydratase n=1 Tax=Nocardia cyriacigeorgica TaxID=135487 RepID=A0A5R8P7V7_9NOCA|nr:enoyl-CoA hydratase-related protein [Nocardia cyriacigeorgica]TLF98267.1 enoyl-CoA hydratase [Nocardia cyriacigeorgica]
MTGDSALLVEDVGNVRVLTLNRPHRKNAITMGMWAMLRDALHDAAYDRNVRALVLTGSGGAFCSGADIADAADVDEFPDPTRDMRAINEAVLRLHDLQVPTIAKVRGVAAGAGWNLALGCDLVVASPDARFCQIFSRRALSLDCGGSWLLPKLVGLQQAKRLALLAEMISAEEAESLGLVTWITPDDELDTFVSDLAARLAAGPPTALAQTKALLNDGTDHTLRDALASEARAQTINLSGRDVLEAFAAFAEKRTPVFTGTWGSGG